MKTLGFVLECLLSFAAFTAMSILLAYAVGWWHTQLVIILGD